MREKRNVATTINSQASTAGAAVYISMGQVVVDIYNVQFMRNQATGAFASGGGAVYISSVDTSVTDAQVHRESIAFEDNQGTRTGDVMVLVGFLQALTLHDVTLRQTPCALPLLAFNLQVQASHITLSNLTVEVPSPSLTTACPGGKIIATTLFDDKSAQGTLSSTVTSMIAWPGAFLSVQPHLTYTPTTADYSVQVNALVAGTIRLAKTEPYIHLAWTRAVLTEVLL